MAKYVLSPKRLSLSHSEFEKTISGSSKETKARYEREWKRYNEHLEGNKKRLSGTSRPEERVREPEIKNKVANEKVSAIKKVKYPIGKKRLDVPYDQAKKDFAKYLPSTQKRYWSAWQKYREDNKTIQQKENPSYRIVVGYKVKIDGEYMKNEDGSIVIFHYSAVREKKRLNKAELADLKEEIQVSTNAKVTDIMPETAYDNWTGKKV